MQQFSQKLSFHVYRLAWLNSFLSCNSGVLLTYNLRRLELITYSIIETNGDASTGSLGT
jgi:hypothetical protein